MFKIGVFTKHNQWYILILQITNEILNKYVAYFSSYWNYKVPLQFFPTKTKGTLGILFNQTQI